MTKIEKVWIVDLPVHIIADSAEAAADHLAMICDQGPVRIVLVDGNGADAWGVGVQAVYANSPEGDIVEAPYHYVDNEVVG